MVEPRSAQPTPVETAQRIAAQIAPRLPDAGASGFDLALDPEELGQIRLRLVNGETGSLLLIHAERPETLDLMRRHIATLESDLRSLGHDQLSLRFSGGGQGQAGGQMGGHPGHQSANPQPQASPPTADAQPTGQTGAASAPSQGHPALRDKIDLRL
ncbi:MAG: flagellar hook-length control protein FliK [Pararhodobacter sp.]